MNRKRSWSEITASFADPPMDVRPRPLWFWNNCEVTDDGIREQMERSASECGYGGFGIVPFGRDFSPAYLSGEYMARYRTVLETAQRLNMTISLYDEYGFPSGSVGSKNSSDRSEFADRYPEQLLHRLDKIEQMITGPAHVVLPLPAGELQAVVAMDALGLRRVVVEPEIVETASGRELHWDAPPSIWQLMAFVCVSDGEQISDYLDPEATRRFIELTHERYYREFSEHFGTTIDSTFHDEPTLYRAGGRTWTPGFVEAYEKRYGEDPRALYPALWYDIGVETAGARTRLFGLRTELFARGFAGELDRWAREHGVAATGHQDQEEIENPVSVSGDLIGCFRYQEIPGVDKIGGPRPAERTYKVIAAAAHNWDRPIVMSETYGAMGDIPVSELYRVALEQYASGINMLIPHALWYDTDQVVFKPELSWRNPLYNDALPAFSAFLSRLNLVLQNDGEHVAEIAMLYPIDGLAAAHTFDGPLGPYYGGVTVPESNYLSLAWALQRSLGYEFTFVHPDALQESGRVSGGVLGFDHQIHRGGYRVVVVPGMRAVRPHTVDLLAEFVRSGGALLVCGALPEHSSDPWKGADAADRFRALVAGSERAVHLSLDASELEKTGGVTELGDALASLLPDPIARVEAADNVLLLHKRYRGNELFLLSNCTDAPQPVTLHTREPLACSVWNPHTGVVDDPADGPAPQVRHEVTLGPTEGRLLVARTR